MTKRMTIISAVIAIILIALAVTAYNRMDLEKNDNPNNGNNQINSTSTIDEDMRNMDSESFDNDFKSIEADIQTY